MVGEFHQNHLVSECGLSDTRHSAVPHVWNHSNHTLTRGGFGETHLTLEVSIYYYTTLTPYFH